MISKFQIENFQSLKKISFDLGLITVVQGESDVGKSALIRAIRAIYRNDISGSWFVSYGEKNTKLALAMDNGVIVALKKGSGDNTYVLKLEGQDQKTFSKMGTAVPDEVQKALNSKRVFYDDKKFLDVNFQSQFDAPFLISSDTGVTAATKIIGTISGINSLFIAMKLIAADLLKAEQEARIHQQEVDDKEERLKTLVDPAHAKLALEVVVKTDNDLKSYTIKKNTLVSLEQRFKRNKEETSKASSVLRFTSSFKPAVFDIEQAVASLNKLRSLGANYHQQEILSAQAKKKLAIPLPDPSTLKTLEEKVVTLSGFKSAQQRHAALVSDLANISKTLRNKQKLEDLASLDKDTEKLSRLKSLQGRHLTLVSEMKSKASVWTQTEKDLAAINTELEQLVASNAKCPTCGTALTKECLT